MLATEVAVGERCESSEQAAAPTTSAADSTANVLTFDICGLQGMVLAGRSLGEGWGGFGKPAERTERLMSNLYVA